MDALAAVLAPLAAAGLDIAHAFDARAVSREPGLAALADPDRPLGILIGNTRALWPRFLAARAADPALRDALDPIELYVERAIDTAVAALPGARTYYAHRRYAGAYLPFQRAAAAAGLGTLTPAHLVIHPTYGPWLALRAIVVAPGTPPPRAPLVDLPGAHDAATAAAYAAALAASGPDAWRAWLAVRDACPIGRAHRYPDAQIRYHYTKDRGEISPGDGDPALR